MWCRSCGSLKVGGKISEITSLNECADSVSLSHYRSSSMHQAVVSISGQWERNVLYQRPFRLALWETSSSCSSTQLSAWFMEMWAISRPAPQSSPDELLLSALVTIVCFPRRPIFIQADKLNLPCFEEAIFLLFFIYDLLCNYQRCEADTTEWTFQSSLGV